jgi:NAD-dependent SIR2 family protein deacetylase
MLSIEMNDAIAALGAFLEQHRRVFVLTGAGCSAPSGIPDYRDAAGAWKHRKPMTFAEFTGSEASRRRYWAGSLRGWPRVRDAQPNAAHGALARLEAGGRLAALVTQNVDGLHQRAGSRGVIDLHGRLDTVECLDCGGLVAREDVQALLLAWNPGFARLPPAAGVDGEMRPDGDVHVAASPETLHVPDCRECGGVLKPGVVFFGESVPKERVEAALEALDGADAMLIVGSSLMVWSGYRFVRAARERGCEVASLGLGRTRADAELSLKVVGDCAALLPALVG